ncbi:hypothetical protein LPMP_262440 [Leishmania panamensis]|uniref:Uncharacterized protein n=5 Tax=Viannia TaxID=37616 RepID=A4HF92_LEIBR|nr:conserved hypothetical protein [Leishmania braziliensis MHOM/BR/75/M2904]XP_010700064.1 hypothetical protein LPMP_262440 [Leishmania panamensis]KAI5685626.1 hypothetical protein MNV84_04832 [Leishmania braziliensis]CCM16529.1 hypothetical protein, conserved [Leishmania guyanensis]AIN99357.1 hypothetical protein LPMP_262440 [Leishmania panamensis]CAJ2474950.1 unnamed protein product [Leishmania braziliensis]CAJ2475451.1 unnamed protein product [Leishmania braziliensis]
MFHTAFLAASKRHLRLRCFQCTRLLPSEHFPKRSGPLNTLVCVGCKEMCFGCGLRQPRSSFSDAGSNICDRCLAKQHVAQENVYFRYPILTYRACPFSVEEARGELCQEAQQEKPPLPCMPR